MKEILKVIQARYSTFGGGEVGNKDNILSIALKDKPLQFAAGVEVKSVVATVLIHSLGKIMMDAKQNNGNVLQAIDDFIVDIQSNL